jgi:uracil phosphoribosyltransferase
LLVEEGLNELPYTSWNVTTPAGCEYEGVKYIKGICGVSIMRSGGFLLNSCHVIFRKKVI